VSCGVGCRRGLDPTWLWLWCRPVATALIRPLAWEHPCATGAAQEMAKRQKKKKIYEFTSYPSGKTNKQNPQTNKTTPPQRNKPQIENSDNEGDNTLKRILPQCLNSHLPARQPLFPEATIIFCVLCTFQDILHVHIYFYTDGRML